ncbi:MAG: nucleotidyltransferase domain-containing protein [Candidatus Bathyarchaeia archaeon]|nr:nucleotidyltransferase domain-containing protein [Candidatus Bathyarchaeota archaeon]
MGKAISALNSQEKILKRARKFIEDAKKICINKGLVFREAYLIGSRARGDYLEDSDADLILLVDGVEGLNMIERLKLFFEALAPRIEFTVYTTTEWLEKESIWINELKKEAVKLE